MKYKLYPWQKCYTVLVNDNPGCSSKIYDTDEGKKCNKELLIR